MTRKARSATRPILGNWRRGEAELRRAGAGEALDEVVEDEVVEQRDGKTHQQRACHQRTPVEDVPTDQSRRETDGHHLLGPWRHVDDGVEVLLHRQREGAERANPETRAARCKYDAAAATDATASVHQPRLAARCRPAPAV